MSKIQTAVSDMITGLTPDFSECETVDITSKWNAMISDIKNDSDESETGSPKTPGMGLTPANILEVGSICVPVINVTIPLIGTIDLWDFLLAVWCGYKLPVTSLFGIPIPLGAVGYAWLKDLVVPGSDLLQDIIDGPHSGTTTGFTVKDVVIDLFCVWAIKQLVSILGVESLEYAKSLFNWYSKYRQPKIRDIVKRVQMPNTPLKYDSGDEPIPIGLMVELFNSAFQLWLSYLTDPMHVQRPI